MKRVMLVSLCVALLAGDVNAQYGTADLWLSSEQGTDTIYMVLSETAVIQVWMSYNPATPATDRMMGGDILLEHRVTEGHDFEVVGFYDHGPWGAGDSYYRFSRGLLDEDPHDGVPDITGVGNLSSYAFTGKVDSPWIPPTNGMDDTGGLILMDEIIIHSVWLTGEYSPNHVSFSGSAGSGTAESAWRELALYNGSYPAVAAEMTYNYLNCAPGQKYQALQVFITGIPEPGSLALLAFGGLAVTRRPRRRVQDEHTLTKEALR